MEIRKEELNCHGFRAITQTTHDEALDFRPKLYRAPAYNMARG